MIGASLSAVSQWEAGLRAGLDAATGGEVSFSRLTPSWSGFVVHDLVVLAEDGAPLLTVDRVGVAIADLESLRTDRWRLTSVDAAGAVLQVRRTSTGFALPRRTLAWLEGDAASGVKLPAVDVARVAVDDASMSVPLVRGEPPVTASARALTVASVAAAPAASGATLSFGAITGQALRAAVEGAEITAASGRASGQGTWTLDGGWWLSALAATDATVQVDGIDVTVASLAADRLALATLDLGAVRAGDVRAVLRGSEVRIATIEADPGPLDEGTLRASVHLGPVVVEGLDRRGITAALDGWAAVRGLGPLSAQLAAVSMPALRLGGTELQAVVVAEVAASPRGAAFGRLEAARATLGPVVLAPVTIGGGRWSPAGLALGPTEAAQVALDLDLYAPHLGLDGLVGVLPAGTTIASLKLSSTALKVQAGARSATGSTATVTATGLTASDAGWSAEGATMTALQAELRSSSGALGLRARSAALGPWTLAERSTVRDAELVEVEAGSRFARAERLTLGADGVIGVVGGEAWLSLVGPHAFAVPPVVDEHVPVGLGGRSVVGRPFFGIDLSGLPWAPSRLQGAGTLHLADDAIGHRTFEVVAESVAVGPIGGGGIPVRASGTVADGRFVVGADAKPDGTVTFALTGRSLDANEFEPYATPLLAKSGLGVGPGRVAVDTTGSLGAERLQLSGDVTVRNLALVVADRKKVGAAMLSAFRGGRFEVASRTVPVEVECALARPACSPIDEVVRLVTEELIDATTAGLADGATGAVDQVREALSGVPGLGKAKAEKAGKAGKAGKAP